MLPGLDARALKKDVLKFLSRIAPLPISIGGTGGTTAATARTALGATSVGSSVFTAADAAAVRTAVSAAGLTGDETIAGVKTFSSSPLLPTPASTDDSTKGATTAYVRDLALGVDQTWTDVMASRLLSTSYSNSTGKPIQVVVVVLASSAAVLTLNVNALGAIIRDTKTSGGYLQVSIVIPTGSTYSATLSTGTGTLQSWFELR